MARETAVHPWSVGEQYLTARWEAFLVLNAGEVFRRSADAVEYQRCSRREFED